jgi:hypothetical protein
MGRLIGSLGGWVIAALPWNPTERLGGQMRAPADGPSATGPMAQSIYQLPIED